VEILTPCIKLRSNLRHVDINIQDDLGGKANSLGRDNILNCEKTVPVNVCYILNAYEDGAV
jgi:hypothetical protein